MDHLIPVQVWLIDKSSDLLQVKLQYEAAPLWLGQSGGPNFLNHVTNHNTVCLRCNLSKITHDMIMFPQVINLPPFNC